MSWYDIPTVVEDKFPQKFALTINNKNYTMEIRANNFGIKLGTYFLDDLFVTMYVYDSDDVLLYSARITPSVLHNVQGLLSFYFTEVTINEENLTKYGDFGTILKGVMQDIE